MANTEKRDPRDLIHFVLAFRRRKLNEDGPVMCFREPILGDEDIAIERLMVQVRRVPGTWRIHRTVNARDTAKAARLLQHRLLENPDDAHALVTVWKTCCLQLESRGERNFLLDVDDIEVLPTVRANLDGIVILNYRATPSGGCHLVTPAFDSREIEKLPGVSIQRDGYLFLSQVEVSGNEGRGDG